MKRRLKKLTNKFSKLCLALLMTLTCINFCGVDVSAATFLPEARASVKTLAENIDIPHLGETANLYNISIGGTDSFCLAHSKSMRSGYHVATGIKVKKTMKIMNVIFTMDWHKQRYGLFKKVKLMIVH